MGLLSINISRSRIDVEDADNDNDLVYKPVVNCCSNRQVQTSPREFAESVELKTDLLEQLRHATDCSNHKHHGLP